MITPHQKTIILQNLNKFSPEFIGILGSYARSEDNAESDIDILIDPVETTNLLEIIGAEQTLEELLKQKIELMTVRSLYPYIKVRVMKDLVRIV